MGQMMGQAMSAASAGSGAVAPPPGGASAPPPPAAGPRWSLTVDGKTYGPYTDEALRTMVAAGQVLPSTLAWSPGSAGWAPLSSYPGFGSGSADAPPPPPPAPKG
jgi:hypothetical protein